METQLQKYNGENTFNNRVEVDFEKRTVEFTPIKENEREGEWVNIRTLFFALQNIVIRIWFYLMAFFVFIDYLKYGVTRTTTLVTLSAVAIGFLFSMYVILLLFLIKK